MRRRQHFPGLLVTFFCLTAWGHTVLAQCAQQPSALIENAYGYQTCTYGAPGTDILTKFWIAGLGASDNSHTMTTSHMITASGQASGNVFPYFAWGDSGAYGSATFVAPQPSAWDTINLVPCGRTVFLYSVPNGGNTQYLLMSVNGDSSGNFMYDHIINGSASSGHGQNVCAPIALPALTITNSATNSDGSYNITVSWPQITATTASGSPTTDLKGYYDTATGLSNLVSGIAIYYWHNPSGTSSPVAPSGYLTSNWTLAASATNGTTGFYSWGTSGTDTQTSLTVTIPGPIPSGTASFLAAALLFDGWTPPTGGFAMQTDFIGPPSVQVGPTPAGVFAGFDAKLAMGTVTATWRSNAEGGLGFYQVYASKLVGGPYVPINGTLTSPMGDSHVYTASFPFPKEIGKRKVFLKVKATDMDGTEWWTQPVKVARRTAP